MALLLAFWRRFPDCCSAWYAAGVTHGIEMGRRQREAEIEAEQEAAWAEMARNVRIMSSILPFAERQARLMSVPADYRPIRGYAECMRSWDDDADTGAGAA